MCITYLNNEETRPTGAASNEHESAGDPVVLGGLRGGGFLGMAVIVEYIEDRTFVKSHHHCSRHRDYCTYHLCEAAYLLHIHRL